MDSQTTHLPDPHAPRGTIALTFDDANLSHLETVAPLLKRHGFGATFFITRFDDGWRRDHGATLLDQSGVRALSDMGFEIGNHTWNHAGGMDGMDDAAAGEEIDRLDRWLAGAGVPRPRVYAYPGGPYSAKGEAVLRARGYVAARLCATGSSPWKPRSDAPFRIPAVPIQEGAEGDLMRVLGEVSTADAVSGAAIPVLVFHGVPDRVHPWVDTEPSTFERHLSFLRDNGWRCISLGEAMARFSSGAGPQSHA